MSFRFVRFRNAVNAALDYWLPRLNDLVMRWDDSSSDFLRKQGVPALMRVRRAGLLVRHGQRYKIFRASGLERASGTPFTVLHLAAGHSMETLNRLFFRDNTLSIERLGSCSRREISRAAVGLAGQADLVVVEGDQPWHPAQGSWMSAPIWIRTRLELDPEEPWDQFLRRQKTQHKNIRRVQKAGFSSRISQDNADFDHFYDQMYIPLALKRHQEQAVLEKKESLYKIFRKGFLLQLLDPNGKVVAGNICYTAGGTLFSFVNGVLDGDQKLIEMGAQSGLYLECIRLAFEKKLKRVDAGGCRPFASDGILSYKLGWGFRPVPDPWEQRRWLFWLPGGSPTAQRWLADHPIVPGLVISGGQHPSNPLQNEGRAAQAPG